jgi:acyl CoA:acetate/3-ketoacid CoA transferase beta subunit
MNEIILNSSLVALIIGTCQVAKSAGVPTKFIPSLAILFGLGGSAFFFFDGTTAQVIFTGIAYGLASVGLFSSVKNTIK